MEDVDDAATPGPRPESTPPVRAEDLRAGDADREVVLERLQAAQAEGRLDLEEFDERVAATLAARTYGELAAVTADLPGGPPSVRPLGAPPPRAPASAAPGQAPQGDGLRRSVTAWAAATLLLMAIWVVAGLTTGVFAYPWWIWVAAPTGVLLLAGRLGTRTGRW
jgi:hypothetical protein